MSEDRDKLDELVEEVQVLADPVEREAVILGTERGSGVLRIPFATSTIVRDEYGRVASLVGPGGTKHLRRDENGAIIEVYDEREEIVPE